MLILLTAQSSLEEIKTPLIFAAIILVLLFVALIISFRQAHLMRKARKERQKELDKMHAQGMLSILTLPHTYGLPVPENTSCEIRTYADHFEFRGGNMDINLSRSKIVDVTVLSDVEIQHQAVSSIGGAALGYAALGPLGAAIGGRVKNHTVRTATPYLIITYRDGEELKHIGFEATASLQKASKLAEEHKRLSNGAGSVKINL